MSITQEKMFCQELVAFLDEVLIPWYAKNTPATTSPRLPLRLKLSDEELPLLAATWSHKHARKFVILDGAPQRSRELFTAITNWSELLDANHRWHFLTDQLSQQEHEGHIITTLSAAMHALLRGTNATDSFVVPASLLKTSPLNPLDYQQQSIRLSVGEKISPRHLAKQLTKRGYTRHHASVEPGGFTIRGENIVVMHPYQNNSHTVTLWHDTIERITVNHRKRTIPQTAVTLPPVSFPKSTATWDILCRKAVVLQPARLAQPPAQHTIIYDALHPEAHFPLTTCTGTAAKNPSAKTFIIYQNRDRLERYAADQELTSPTWCQASLAQIPLCLVNQQQTIITEARIFPKQRVARPSSYQKGLELIQELTVGKPAVHSDHGIGIYDGLQTKTYDGNAKEYLLLRYAAGDTLAVPVEYAHKVTAYIGQASPTIHRLNTASWANVKRAAHHDAVRFARELLTIAGRRQKVTGHAYHLDQRNEERLKASFPFEMTLDQKQAWRDVRADLVKPAVMDRLIVGDVGFGKTEIAIRAAYHVAASGKQVAILAPTTLLVQQHADSFRQRLDTMKEQIGVLSRFASSKQKREVQEKISTGDLSIVIGTHALLQPDIFWRNLGLVIIDEEQRFGVSHKEHFKNIRARIDLLSLSATPIPRTLSMALTGLKQLSIISAPPAGRKAVKTHVGLDSDATFKKAIERERERGGQTYVVAPHVRKLPALQHRVEKLIPQATVAQAHGQMPAQQLAATMNQFDQGKIDVLVSSSIIEHGIDLPNANTIIVTQATQFGLADLYQLRGRIGRRQRQGYAYFVYNQSELTSLQKQHLVALTEASRLGSGWSLAQRDLEIRGAGNLLGADQSGSVSNIGVQLYLDMVHEETARHERGQLHRHDVDIQFPLPTLIPAHYIADHTARARAYQQLARAKSPRQLKERRASLEQVFGPLPEEANNLYLTLELQHAAARATISSITTTTITPIGEEAHLRLILAASQPADIQTKLNHLGQWHVRDNTITLDIDTLTPQLVCNLVSALQ